MADRPVDDASTRGHLDVRLAAITRIVEQVVARTEGTQAHTSALGSTLGRAAQRNLPRVDIQVAGRGVRIRADVGGAWPGPLAEVGDRVRAALLADTERLTGLRVRRADVVVHALRHDDLDRPVPVRRGRVA